MILSTLIDLTRLTQIWLVIASRYTLDPNTVNTLLKRAYNVCTLGISIKYNEVTVARAQDICSMMPGKIKHLKIVTKHIESMKLILKQVKHLTSVTFFHRHVPQSLWSQVIVWFKQHRGDFIYEQGNRFLKINMIQQKEEQAVGSSN
jgi:hypothetical protein